MFLMCTIGISMKKHAEDGIVHFFNGGRNIPWWLAGISMVATTFAADTPLAVTGIIASNGIAGNWIWWNFMFSGMFTVFLYSKLWHRAGVKTDVEFISLRYSGKPAKYLRGFRALYLALPINCIILGWVTVGMSKVLQVITGSPQWQIIIFLYLITTIYIAISGIWGVVSTDFFQFFVAMFGSIILMLYGLEYVGGMGGLISEFNNLFGSNHSYFDFSPFKHPKILLSTALVWIGMQWWAAWYPGAEPGGGGYIAQRMFSTKSDKDAVKATLLFNIAHYAIRPWPWIVVALISLIVYPGIDDPEIGYPLLMVKLLPSGLLGLLLVSFISAFMSTISTHLNWGASYIVNDFYIPFMRSRDSFENKKKAEEHYVFISRISTILMMGIAICISWFFDSVKGGWEFILSLGAGTGLVYMLRWYWYRINAWSEISAMLAAFIGSVLSNYLGFNDFSDKMIFTTIFTTSIWLFVTFLTVPEPKEVLDVFYNKINPAGPGWKKVNPQYISILPQLLNIILGIIIIQGFLFGIGNIIFEKLLFGLLSICLAIISVIILLKRI